MRPGRRLLVAASLCVRSHCRRRRQKYVTTVLRHVARGGLTDVCGHLVAIDSKKTLLPSFVIWLAAVELGGVKIARPFILGIPAGDVRLGRRVDVHRGGGRISGI